MKKLTLISALAISLSLSACAVTTAGVKPGDERNFNRSLNDISVERVIEARLKRADGYDLNKVDVEVAEGIVVLAGTVPTDEDRIEAERIAWSAPYVDEIGNEIIVGVVSRDVLGDNLLGSSVRARLFADKSVKSRNISIEARNGIVYLLGVARTPEELERAAHIASTTRGVHEVVSYVKIHDGVSAGPAQDFAGSGVDYPQYNAPLEQALIEQVPLGQVPLGQAPLEQRALPDFLSETPQGALLSAPSAPAIDPLAPYYRDPLTGERIELDPSTGTIPFQAPSANSVAKALPLLQAPTDLPGASVGSALGSVPFYIDPDTGQQIPVKYIR